MAVKKSELYTSLWNSCDELRGGMDTNGNSKVELQVIRCYLPSGLNLLRSNGLQL